jgi:hypothetical protein
MLNIPIGQLKWACSSKWLSLSVARGLKLRIIATVAFVVGTNPPFIYAQEAFIRDSQGCGVYNQHPKPGEQITWSGDCQGGLAQGPGTVQWLVNGNLQSTEIAQFKNGKTFGHATITSVDGTRTDLEFHDGKVTHAKTQFANGNKSEWDFPQGDNLGRGTFVWADGTIYKGDWLDGHFNGRGVTQKPDGAKYMGEYKNDRFDGIGTLSYSNGFHYAGEFRNGKRDGFGTLITKDGKYTGYFVDDKQEGHGIWIGNDGKQFEGEWKNGIPLGVAKNSDGNSGGPVPTSPAVSNDPNPKTFWVYCELVFDAWRNPFEVEPGYGEGDHEYTPVFSIALDREEFGNGPGSKSEAYANNLIEWTKSQHPLASKTRASCWWSGNNKTDSTKEEAEAARERSIAIWRQGHPRRDTVHFVDYIPRA